jgi:hypothetical protein
MIILVPTEPSFIPQAKAPAGFAFRMAEAVTALWPSRDETRGPEQ